MTRLVHQRPVARRDGVLIEPVDDEVVLYEPSSDQFVRLNATAFFVWTRCDGASSVAEIVEALEQEHDIEEAAEVVWLALDLLSTDGLLDGPVVVPEPPEDAADGPMSRRTMLRLAGVGLAIPIVASIGVPSAAAAMSLPGGGGGGGGPVGPMPVDCVVSSWSAYDPCTKSCGGGTTTRTRTIVTPPANGGAPCPALVETTSCNDQPCPVDCVVSDWSPWSACSAPCGGGTQMRTRTVITSPMFGGSPCPALVETRPCNSDPCP